MFLDRYHSIQDGKVLISATEGSRFAKEIAGDFNPIHYDEPYATRAGNESVFAQGMLTMGVAGHAVADWVGLNRVSRLQVRFQDQVWPGDAVTVGGEVIEMGRAAFCSAAVAAEVVTVDIVSEDDDKVGLLLAGEV